MGTDRYLKLLSSYLLGWNGAFNLGRVAIRYLAHHTGLPALLVAAILVVVGYRILKRTARFAIEVAAIALVLVALVAATELGFLRW